MSILVDRDTTLLVQGMGRVGQLHKLANVEVYLDSALTAANVREFGFQHVVLATG